MDSAFVPSELIVKHYVHHKFTLDFGPSITSFGKPIRNVILAAILIYSVAEIVRGSLQAVLSRNREGTKDSPSG